MTAQLVEGDAYWNKDLSKDTKLQCGMFSMLYNKMNGSDPARPVLQIASYSTKRHLDFSLCHVLRDESVSLGDTFQRSGVRLVFLVQAVKLSVLRLKSVLDGYGRTGDQNGEDGECDATVAVRLGLG